MRHMKWSRIVCAIGVLLALGASTAPSAAQGVTTAAVTGVVKDAQGAVIPGATIVAVHVPSGTTYEAVTEPLGSEALPGAVQVVIAPHDGSSQREATLRYVLSH